MTSGDVLATVDAVQAQGFPDARLAAEWRGVTAATDGTGAVEITLPAPRASFAAAASDLQVVPEAVARIPLADLERTRTRPLPADGAYRVRSSDERSVVVEVNPASGVHPRLHVLELDLEPDFDTAARALASRQVDAMEAATPSERSALAKLSGITLHDTVSFRFVDLILNARLPGLDDVAVRKAIASAVNRHTIIESALDGAARPQVDAEPAGIAWLGTGTAEDPEPQLAARALDAAGWTAGGDGEARHRGGAALTFSLTVPSTPPLPEVADELSAQLAEIGIVVDVVPVSEARFDSVVLQSQSFDMALADWDSGPDPDLSMFWRSNARPPHGENVSGTSLDLFLDRALDDLATETDPQLRQSAAARVEQRLADEAPAVFLYAPVTSFATRASLTHVRVPAVGRTGSRYDFLDEWRLAAGGP